MSEPSSSSMTLQEFEDCKTAVKEAVLIALLFLEERTGMQVLGLNVELADDALFEFRFGELFNKNNDSPSEPEPEAQ